MQGSSRLRTIKTDPNDLRRDNEDHAFTVRQLAQPSSQARLTDSKGAHS